MFFKKIRYFFKTPLIEKETGVQKKTKEITEISIVTKETIYDLYFKC